MTYLESLRQRLASRTDAEGKPLKGYKNNVIAIRAAIASLETALAAPAGGPTESDVDMPQEHV